MKECVIFALYEHYPIYEVEIASHLFTFFNKTSHFDIKLLNKTIIPAWMKRIQIL